MSAFSYETNCTVASPGPIQHMIDRAVDVSYDTLARRVGTQELAEVFPDYTWGRWGEDNGLRMREDWAVSYYRSVYRGLPCYFVVHSGIEYVFVENRTSQALAWIGR